MDTTTIEALADRLIAAEATRTPIEVLSTTHPEISLDDGYAIQRAIVRKKVARGARVIGKKVAFTSQANQEMFGVREPIYGQLLDRGAHAEGVPVMASTLIDPVVDCEVGFVMRRRLEGPGVTLPDILRASEGIMPAFELADCRMRDWIGRAKAADILADSCANVGSIVGGQIHSLRRFDLRYTGLVAEKNGEIIGTAATGAVLGNPAEAVAWLANKLAEAELALEEGDLVLSGAVIGSVRMAAGDVLKATFGGGLGSVGLKFV